MGFFHRQKLRHRLYLQIYFSLVMMIVLVSIIAPLLWALFAQPHMENRVFSGISYLVSKALPQDQPKGSIDKTIKELSRRFSAHISIYTRDRKLIASSGTVLPCPLMIKMTHWDEGAGAGPRVSFQIPDGRVVVASSIFHHDGHHILVGAFWILLASLLLALAAYPVARRLTRRLERLQEGVISLGSGALDTRVPIEGCDEVGELARSFNQAAERIEALVKAQKNMLAEASHEFRTPLTRIRVALELYEKNPGAKLKEELHADIEELDNLVDEVLTTSRLDTLKQAEQAEKIDLLALLAEEASRYNAEVSGESVIVEGDLHLLRRLIRNLLENGRRYGGATGLSAGLESSGEFAVITICDRGPGISTDELEKIFEPFYRPSGHHESDHGGAGLGLALVKQIALLHGGRAMCKQRDEGGTCFEIRIKRIED
jgi:signal transduction histidine kinase